MFLFILESIGTQELILIAGVALIIFGPRKLPDIVKTIGKTMAQFKNATNEFKSTWEKEVAFEEEDKTTKKITTPAPENSIYRENQTEELSSASPIVTTLPRPEVKELSSEEIARIFPNKENQNQTSPIKETATETTASAKRDWL